MMDFKKQNKKTFVFQDNSFDILRIVGAYIVLFSHSFRWFGIDKPAWTLFLSNGAVGVMMFFSMTGFMMMSAYERAKNSGKSILSFYWNRIIRIYPALVLSFILITFINVFMMGENILTFDYIKYAVKYCIFARGGAYGTLGISNGVLWTIAVDMVFYLITPIVYRVMYDSTTKVWLIVIALFSLFNFFDKQTISILKQIPYIGKIADEGFPLCFIYEFLIGCFFYFKREAIISRFQNKMSYTWLLVAIFAIYYSIWSFTSIFPKNYLMHEPELALIVCPITIICGYSLGKHRIKWEISYGLFLFHMIVIQVLIKLNIIGYNGIVLTAIITPILAMLSKRTVEDPCLRLKR